MPDFSPLSRQLNTDSWPKRALCYFFPALLPYTPQKQSVLPASLHLSFLSPCPPESLKPWAIFEPAHLVLELLPFLHSTGGCSLILPPMCALTGPGGVDAVWLLSSVLLLPIPEFALGAHISSSLCGGHPPRPHLISDSEPRSIVVQCRISGPLPGWFLTVF